MSQSSPGRLVQCGICGEAMSSERAAAQHLRERHATANAQLVCVSATTLERNRHGLFDREAPPEQQHHQALVVPLQPQGPSLQFVRDGSEIRLQQPGRGQQLPLASSPLHTQLVWRRNANGSICKGPAVERTPVSASRASASRRVMWLGVGSGGHQLKEGELIKLGSFTLSVRQIVFEGPPQVPRFSSHRDPETAVVRHTAQPNLERDAGSALCRICLGGPGQDDGDGEEDEGPLILAPCLCRGNVQRVHLGCLRQWLSVRYSVENRMVQQGAVALSFKPPGCEICRTEFPATYEEEGADPDAEPVPLLTSLPLVTPPFIVLSVPKSSGDDRERPHGERCVFAPNGVQDAVLKIGRQRGAELRLNDSSVSRVHATIRFGDGGFLLYDNNARFRTLVLPTGPQPVTLAKGRHEPLSVQAGRTLLSFALFDPETAEATPTGGRAAEANGTAGMRGSAATPEEGTNSDQSPEPDFSPGITRTLHAAL